MATPSESETNFVYRSSSARPLDLRDLPICRDGKLKLREVSYNILSEKNKFCRTVIQNLSTSPVFST